MTNSQAHAFLKDIEKICIKHDVGHALIIAVDKQGKTMTIQEAVQIAEVPQLRMIRGFAESIVKDIVQQDNQHRAKWN